MLRIDSISLPRFLIQMRRQGVTNVMNLPRCVLRPLIESNIWFYLRRKRFFLASIAVDKYNPQRLDSLAGVILCVYLCKNYEYRPKPLIPQVNPPLQGNKPSWLLLWPSFPFLTRVNWVRLMMYIEIGELKFLHSSKFHNWILRSRVSHVRC